MDLLVRLLAIYAAIAGVMAATAFGVLRLLKKNPSFATVFVQCVIALFLLSTLSTVIISLTRHSSDQLRSAIVRYTIYEVAGDGHRKPLASGALRCNSENLHSAEMNVLGRHFRKKWFTLEKGFAIGGDVYCDNKLSGFGLWISKDGGGTSWDWFTLDTGLVYRKLQGEGRVKVTFVPYKDCQKLASVEFLDDVTLRGYFGWVPLVMTHQIEVQKGSILRFSP